MPSREITKEELALAHTDEHIQNYYTPPPWYKSSKPITRLPSPPPSSTESTTTTTITGSAQTTPPPLNTLTDSVTESDYTPQSDEEKPIIFAESPSKTEFEPDFPPLTPTATFSDRFSGFPETRRASGLDMDLMIALAAKAHEIEAKPMVWPETLSHTMGCGELAIGSHLTTHLIVAVDTTFDPDWTPQEARLATGALLNLCDAVVTRRVKNGFALIRPPGHHAEPGLSA